MVLVEEDVVVEDVNIIKNLELDKEKLATKRAELKERFLREEISAEEYSKLKGDLEREVEELEKKKEEKPKEQKEFRHKIISRTKKGNIWLYISIILGLLLIISLFSGSERLSESDAAEKSINYINDYLLKGNTKATLLRTDKVSGVYKITLNLNGQSLDSYITKDGSLLFPTGINIDENIDKPLIKETETNSEINTNVNIDDDPIKGNKNAPITIIEFSDYQCPFCTRAEPTIKQVLETYKDKVRFIYRDFPLGFHQYAQKAAEASECADEQGKFWEYHDLLFEKQSEWSSEGITKLKEYALNLGLDAKQFNECLDSGKMASEVQKDFNDGQQAGVSGTPAFFINGRLVSGAQPFSAFKQVIDEELNKK